MGFFKKKIGKERTDCPSKYTDMTFNKAIGQKRPTTYVERRLYLDVPIYEKEQAKALGARWDQKVKKWYTIIRKGIYRDFSRWIIKESGSALIAMKHIYIVEGWGKCPKCSKMTKVIALGLSECIIISGEPGDIYCDICDDTKYGETGVTLAWVDDEDKIPPKLLKYLKEHYSVKMGGATEKSKDFANYCNYCGRRQSNRFLFESFGSPFSSVDSNLNERPDRMKKLLIKKIPIRDNLILDWFGNGDCVEGEIKVEELTLSSNPKNKCITYAELYGFE